MGLGEIKNGFSEGVPSNLRHGRLTEVRKEFPEGDIIGWRPKRDHW